GLRPAIVMNVTAPDAASFRRSEAEMAALLARAVARGRRGL
ncbi:MAG: phage tail tape measure protein, partial [Phreatobacter sp.]|nr:phage tail tape measure protein [Phreatobacter sp.]